MQLMTMYWVGQKESIHDVSHRWCIHDGAGLLFLMLAHVNPVIQPQGHYSLQPSVPHTFEVYC